MDTPVKESTDGELGFHKRLPRFKTLETEREFRSSFLQQDKFFAKLIIAGTLLISLASLIPDTLSGASSDTLKTLYLATFIYFTFTSIILVTLSSTHRYRRFDLVTTLWWVGVIVVGTLSNTLYPADVKIHVVFDVLFPVAIYLLIPIGLISQCLLASLFTVTNLVILLTLKENITDTDLAFIFIAYTATHVIGLIACWQSHIGRRKQFVEKKTEQRLRKELQGTLDELQVLRGILPICSYCKQIRDDEGFWHQVDQYINSHSDIQFTHGICPDCIKENFPREHKILEEQESRSD